nr:MAG TPA: DNA-directed RNA polymerase [Caudoviricetes sp.]
MTEYIKRNYLRKMAMFETAYTMETETDAAIVLRMIDDAPTADVAPVVHGQWILEREPNGKPYCFHCSVCDSDYHCIGIVVASDYCPNCGAKMDGGVDNEID